MALFSSKTGESAKTNEIDLPALIKESYTSGETDGVQDAFSSNDIMATLSTKLDSEKAAEELVSAAAEAAGTDRGGLASMINAILASCCGSEASGVSVEQSSARPRLALSILGVVDEMYAEDETSMVSPDIVSLALVYYSLRHSPGATDLESEAQSILERAQRLAKKMAGSQRRKELAAERRKGGKSEVVDTKEVESNLQSLCGPDIQILHNTNEVIVISKPSGIVCYHTKKTGAGKISSSRKKKSKAANANGSDGGDGESKVDFSLVDALLGSSIPLSTLNPTASARGIVHRLDRGTSGSIILAKTDEVHLRLVALFFLRRAKKKYLALVPGDENAPMGTGNDLPLSIGSTGDIVSLVDGRPAQSTYRVVKANPEACLLEVATLTGRKHQVRVHCASALGRPIFLDPLYSPGAVEKKPRKTRQGTAPVDANNQDTKLPKAVSDTLEVSKGKERFFLHAESLSIPELEIEVQAPVPKWWLSVMDELDLQ